MPYCKDMSALLAGKVALITGGSRGIGKAIASAFAQQGATVVFTYVSKETAMQTLEALQALGGQVVAYQADATDYDVAKTVVDNVMEQFGRIDVLVNNAGITQDGLLMRMRPEQFDRVIQGNLRSVFNYCQLCTPIMMRQRAGSIINMSSVVGLHGNAGQCNYAASKAGIIGLTQSMAKELGGKGIRINAIAPGFIQTDMTQGLSDDVKDKWIKEIPLKRIGMPEDIAQVALFLASDMSAYVTGQTLSVDGGKCI